MMMGIPVSPVWFEPEHHLPPAVHWQGPFPAVLKYTWFDPPPLLGWKTHTNMQRQRLSYSGFISFTVLNRIVLSADLC